MDAKQWVIDRAAEISAVPSLDTLPRLTDAQRNLLCLMTSIRKEA